MIKLTPLVVGTVLAVAGTSVPATAAYAASSLIGTPVVGEPTPTALGVQLPLTGAGDGTLSSQASVAVQYRVTGTATWRTGLPLHRVRPSTVFSDTTIAPQFAGSILDLTPATSYDIQLHVVDPGTGTDQTVAVPATTTRAVPVDPTTHPATPLTSAGAISAALQNAKPGDIIEIASGVYSRQYNFSLPAGHGGTAAQPVVIRSAPGAHAVLQSDGVPADGAVLSIAADNVTVEDLDVRSAAPAADGSFPPPTTDTARRGIRFYHSADQPIRGGVVRRVHISGVDFGISGDATFGLNDGYICDNTVDGTEDTRSGKHYVLGSADNWLADLDGIQYGSGTVVCNNKLTGFGDAIVAEESHIRNVDIYGNDVVYTYDNGVEADHSEGNVRIYRNRFLDSYMPLSFQPVFGGPDYAFRNVLINSISEPFKMHNDQNTSDNPNGVLVYNNTVDKAGPALELSAAAATTDSTFEDNLFVGSTSANPTVSWVAPTNNTTFDYDGYYPNTTFRFDDLPRTYANLADLQQNAQRETHGRSVGAGVFKTLQPWPSTSTLAQDATSLDASLADNSAAIDAGLPLPTINDVPDGHPDLGAVEHGCPAPVYGPQASDSPPVCTGQPAGATPVTWTNLRSTAVDGTRLVKSGGVANAQDAGASSVQPVTGGLTFRWPAATASGCVGMAANDPDTSCAAITYRIVVQPYQGAPLATAYVGTAYAGNVPFAVTDTLGVRITGSTITFERNGVSFASTAAPATALHADTSLWDLTSEVDDATLAP